MKLYDLIKQLLTDHEYLRDSDKKLIWRVWGELGYRNAGYGEMLTCIFEDDFMRAPSTESIRRCRQKIQEKHPELRGSEKVRKARAEKAEEKGTWVYRESYEEMKKQVEHFEKHQLKLV